MSGSELRRGTAYSLISAIAGAAFLIPYKKASLLTSASTVAFMLLTASAVLSTAGALFEIRGRWRLDRTSIITGIGLGIFSITGNLCSAQALELLEPAIASVLMRTQIIFVAIAAALLLREPIRRSVVVGGAIALVGLWLMRDPGTDNTRAMGIVWALGASASFAGMIVATRAVATRIRPNVVNTLRLWIAVALLGALPSTRAGALAADAWLWLLAAAAALCGPVVSRLCIMVALRYIPAALHTLVAMTTPLLALGFGVLAFGTVPTPTELVGGLIIFVGIVVPVLHAAASRGAKDLPAKESDY